MKGVAALVLLLASTCLSRQCAKERPVLICYDFSSLKFDVEPGFPTLILILSNVGEINSTVLQSTNLSSITRLIINNAGITGIAKNAFSSFVNLRSLSLEENKLSQINTNWFPNPAVLSELNLAGNRVEVVNESTFRFPNLTKLTLNRNWIKHVHPDSFSSQSRLAELDLSKNRLMWVSPQVFSSLRSLKSIALDGNPWNCSCDHKDFVASIKDLQNNSRLNSSAAVTCETPPALKGQPVWNVSVCPVSPPSVTPTHPATSSTSTVKAVTVSPLQPSSKTETSLQTKPADVMTIISSHTAALSAMQTSSTDAQTAPASTAEVVTTRPSQQTSKKETSFLLKPTEALSTISPHSDTSIHPKPTNTPETVPKTTGPPDANIVCTLIAVIAALCALLCAVCFLAVLHRQKHANKTVMPGCLKEKKLEEGGRSSNDQSEECSNRDPEMMGKKSGTGVRAKSANAVILTSPFGSSDKDKVTFQTQTKTPSGSSEKPGGRKQKLETEDEAAAAGRRGIPMENQTTTDTVKEYKKREDDDDENLYENPECVFVNIDTIPYLNIGANQNNPSPEDEPSADPSQRSQMGKVIGRISTWPPTAVQWQARSKMKEGEEEEDGEDITVWTHSEAIKLSDEAEKIRNKMKQHESSEQCEKEDETEKNLSEAHVNLRDSLILRDSTTEEQLKQKGTVQNPATERQTKPEISPNHKPKSAETPPHKSGSKTEVSSDLKRDATGRQRAENRAASSKAPSGGTSPDDETLLSGNEYAFMDLLHEVSQNNGRWTRERWKQTHANKQQH